MLERLSQLAVDIGQMALPVVVHDDVGRSAKSLTLND
jgi:hypothetical protein